MSAAAPQSDFRFSVILADPQLTLRLNLPLTATSHDFCEAVYPLLPSTVDLSRIIGLKICLADRTTHLLRTTEPPQSLQADYGLPSTPQRVHGELIIAPKAPTPNPPEGDTVLSSLTEPPDIPGFPPPISPHLLSSEHQAEVAEYRSMTIWVRKIPSDNQVRCNFVVLHTSATVDLALVKLFFFFFPLYLLEELACNQLKAPYHTGVGSAKLFFFTVPLQGSFNDMRAAASLYSLLLLLIYALAC